MKRDREPATGDLRVVSKFNSQSEVYQNHGLLTESGLRTEAGIQILDEAKGLNSEDLLSGFDLRL